MIAYSTTWWTVLRICLEERLVYRGDFALGTLARFMPIVTQIFLWTSIFAASGKDDIEGYTRNTMIAYYLLTTVSRAFSSMPGLATGIAAQVRSGEIKKFMIQPIDLMGYLLMARIAHKAVYYVVAIGPFVLVFFLCRGFFHGWPPPEILGAFFLSLIMSFMLGFFLEAAIGMISFWFLEVSSLMFVYMLFNFFFSGHMFPLELLREYKIIFGLSEILPFRYLAYFPATVFLQNVRGAELVWGLCIQASWVVFFALFCRWAQRVGMNRYGGFGG